MEKVPLIIGPLCLVSFLAGCTATQSVVWRKAGPVDLAKGGKVIVNASCEIPSLELDYLQHDIQEKVEEVLLGNTEATDSYKVNVTITKYDEGHAYWRFVLIGLGQMHLHGTVEITQGDPSVVIREGELKKNYCVGGVMGGGASMQKDILPKVGQAIAEAIKCYRPN